MIAVGKNVGATRLWRGPGERRSVGELLEGRRGLFLFYLFDWSST